VPPSRSASLSAQFGAIQAAEGDEPLEPTERPLPASTLVSPVSPQATQPPAQASPSGRGERTTGAAGESGDDSRGGGRSDDGGIDASILAALNAHPPPASLSAPSPPSRSTAPPAPPEAIQPVRGDGPLERVTRPPRPLAPDLILLSGRGGGLPSPLEAPPTVPATPWGWGWDHGGRGGCCVGRQDAGPAGHARLGIRTL
jgi:hypothetical protein